MKEKEINIVLKNPWKKVIIVGIVIIAFVIVTEIVSRYSENLLPNIYTNPYFIYVIVIPAVILISVFLFIYFKRKKKFQTILKKDK